MNANYRVVTQESHETVAFAALELRRCLDRLPPQSGQGCITLKLIPQPELHPFDDRIGIDVTGGTGVISGPNPRSILLGVYRYLRELGCRFLFPGKAGELYPEALDLPGSRVQISEMPRRRYRGICIEGGNRLETLLDMIDFLPKLGFNSYFIQFRHAFVFFRRWYRHTSHPQLQDNTPYPVEEAERNMAIAEREIARRGLCYHAVGHGWTCDPFGVPGLEWDPWKGEVPEEARQYFALVNGKRDLWGGVPLNTSVCFSNPKAREIMVEAICDYAASHPEADVVHIWLADGHNNHCECDNCRTRIPSDWYIMLLNEVDAALTARGLATKLCFLIYCELLWPPVTERLRNPDRFVLMFAPISRTYRTTFSASGEGRMAPYVRNQIEMPASVADNLAHLRAWQKLFDGDGFLFDYHYMWAHHRDAGCFDIAKILYEDMQNLDDLGLNGLMSCQVQRALLPNAMGITVMAGSLWGYDSFESITGDYMSSLYGDNAPAVTAYMKELSRLSTLLNMEQPQIITPEKAEAARQLEAVLTRALQTFDFGSIARLPQAGEYLRIHAELWLRLAKAFVALEEGDSGKADLLWQEARAYLWDNEPATEPCVDCFNFDRTFHKVLHQQQLAFS